ncbi:MAG: hypothetical protein RM338_25765 [Nostoc sp. DedQUE12a]|nr:hypothetical protein [Nostoc sp. DedQUE12a]
MVSSYFQLIFSNIVPNRYAKCCILEESDKSKDDLVAVLGSENLVENILNGQEKINTEQARKLGELFHVESSLFMG